MIAHTAPFIAFIIFIIGLAVVLIRRELLFILMGIELLFNGAALVAITATQYWMNATGQVLTIVYMIVAGAELSVSLLIVMYCYRIKNISCIDQLNQLHD